VTVKLSDLGFASTCRVRDLWRKQELGVFKGEITLAVNWHGAGLYRVSIRQ
jgi:alpha-galactosidase